MDAAVRTYQEQSAQDADSDKESTGSLDSVLNEKDNQKSSKESKKKMSKSSRQKEVAMKERIQHYRDGTLNLPAHEVIQNSFHFKTGKVDLQLCDDTSGSGVTDTVQGSMLIQVIPFVFRKGYPGAGLTFFITGV